MSKKILIYQDKDKKRIIGWIENETFIKKINPNFHLQRIWGDTPGIQKVIWDRIEDKVKEIKVFAGKIIFKISKEIFNREKVVKDYGHGLQYFVNRRFWEIENPYQKKLF